MTSDLRNSLVDRLGTLLLFVVIMKFSSRILRRLNALVNEMNLGFYLIDTKYLQVVTAINLASFILSPRE